MAISHCPVLLVGAWALVLSGGAVAADQGPGRPAATTQPGRLPVLSEADRAGLERLRGELFVESEHLRHMGPDTAQADAILRALRTWYQRNQVALDAARLAENAARRQAQQGWQTFHRAPPERAEAATRELERLKEQLRAAEAALAGLIQSAADAVEAVLSEPQRRLRRVVQTNTAQGAFGEYLYAPDLTAEQLRLLRRAKMRLDVKLNQADTEKAREQAAAEHRADAAEILTPAQQQAIAAAQANARASAAAVQAAEARVLPDPANAKGSRTDLQEDRIETPNTDRK